MKVLINAISAKMGGAKIILNAFLNNIDPQDKNEYYFMINKSSVNEKLIKKHQRNIHFYETDYGEMKKIKRYFWYQYSLPKFIKKNNFNYMINLTNYGPRKPCCKEILLCHNSRHVSKEIRDNINFLDRLKLILENLVLKISLKGSEKIVVQTNYMKKGLVQKFKCDEKKIHIIPIGTNDIDKKLFDENLERKLIEFIKAEQNVIANISLYTKHKNLERMLEAIKIIKQKYNYKIKLIMTINKEEEKAAETLLKLIDEYDISDYVLSVGNIKHDYIYQVLEKAKAFVFPSYGESFGIPFVEAMNFKLPIVAADLEFAHDVCGNAALYFDYRNSEDLAKRIIEILQEDKHNALKQNSIERSKLYDEKYSIREYFRLLK